MTLEIYLDNTLVASKSANISTIDDTDSISHTCGSITVTYYERINYHNYGGQPSWQDRFKEIDAPARGYQLVRHVAAYSGSGSGTPPAHDYNYTNPIAYPNDRQDNNVNEYHNTRNPNGTWSITLRVYFTKIPRAPTHLLVNSSTIEAQPKLVYDPTTNRLVADF